MGQGASQALLSHVIIGCVNVVTTLVAVFTVDRCAARELQAAAGANEAGAAGEERMEWPLAVSVRCSVLCS